MCNPSSISSMPNSTTYCHDDITASSHSGSMLTSRSLLVIPQSPPGIQRLPYEIMAYITNYLDIDEVFILALCSSHFQYLVREERFCKTLINTKASHTIEAREAQQSGLFARALRRVAKRHQAISQASPYVVGIVGVADSYEYVHGMLCYIVEDRPQRWLRILDLHRSASNELVVDIPALIREAVPRSAKSRKYKFRVLYHADGITSCLFSFALPNTENWLLIFQAEEKEIVAKMRLESTAKIFVRNNHKFLYFGTHSDEGADGFRKWVLTGFRIEDRHWFPHKMHLTNVVGNDIGTTVCFEIIDDHFYGLSNQTDYEIRETDWVSYYHCFRFPLHTPDRKNTQTMDKDDGWRRQHAEGPIDDRWGLLKLEKDEASGTINIIESRKEWLAGKSGSRRTFYMTKVIFGETPQVDGNNDAPVAEGGARLEQRSSRRRLMDRHNGVVYQRRSPQNVHPGDDSSMTPIFTRSQTHMRSYQRYSSTYLDLVDHSSGGSASPRRLRLRTGHRTLKRILFSGECPIDKDGQEVDLDQRIKELYHPDKIYFWPPEQDSFNQNSFLDKIYEILNPPSCLGSITAFSDERSLVYAIGEDMNGLKLLVYISFDPAARLAGMLREKYILGERYMPSICGETTGLGNYSFGAGTRRTTEDVKTGDDVIGGFPRRPLPSYISDPPTPEVTIIGNCKPWAWLEKAMHQTLEGKSFTFAH
ncbi:hypothetical protein F4804DRAFT_298552 [Jackrogersella minutella]|nr:hypothetical protein F4804DRAFT_298552 [Jackrogersella minutella]